VLIFNQWLLSYWHFSDSLPNKSCKNFQNTCCHLPTEASSKFILIRLSRTAFLGSKN